MLVGVGRGVAVGVAVAVGEEPEPVGGATTVLVGTAGAEGEDGVQAVRNRR